MTLAGHRTLSHLDIPTGWEHREGNIVKTPWVLTVVLMVAPMGAAADRLPLAPFESPTDLRPQGEIDRLVFARLRELGIEPARVCSDAVFVRRVYLDVIGTLPTAQEAQQFLAEHNSNKRGELIDQLLERAEFADYWALKWSDLLRVKAEFPINLWPNAVQAYHRWIRTSIKENLPYNRFVRAQLTASGSNFRVPPVNFYRAVQSNEPASLAQAVALTWMGTRAQKWPADRLAGMAAFFSYIGYKRTDEWKEEIVFFDAERLQRDAAAGRLPNALLPDGTQVPLAADQDPREVFADWLVGPNHRVLARTAVNRVWCWLLGRGIVDPPDDIRPDNPASNPRLLAYLERQLVGSHYDLKQIYRQILCSQVYQLSSIPRTTDPAGAVHFAYYPVRRLDAEVLIDALCQVTGTTEEYSSPIPEPFAFLPQGQRSIALADGSITSAFLEMFGRPPRDTGLAAERNNRPTAAQRLYLLNSTDIQRRIERGPKLRHLVRVSRQPRQVMTRLYLTILSRFPTEEELRTVQAYAPSGRANRDTLIDLAWALINSPEFLYRH